jgi:hypothetical protein
MRNSLISLVVALAVVAGSAALFARQQSQPGMSAARFWINNRTPNEAIPINVIVSDPKAVPLPVIVNGVAAVDFSDRAVGTLSQLQGKTQSTSATRQPWEYREVVFTPNQNLGTLNSLGADGWEAAGMTTQPNGSVTVLLKRPR